MAAVVPLLRSAVGRTVFENHGKSLIQHCERSKLRLHFEWTENGQFWRVFKKLNFEVKKCLQIGQFL